MDYTTLFFDLDDTLYPNQNGLWRAIRDRMGKYMLERMRLPEQDVPQLRKYYYETYGTTLRGLQIHHQVNVDDYLAYVHDLPLADYLQPEPELRKVLLSLPQKRWIFTNADHAHARRVMAILGVEDCFHGIIDIYALDFICKPDFRAYKRAMQVAGEKKPENCVLLDDSTANLEAAKKLGFYAVLVNGNVDQMNSSHLCLESLLSLPEAMSQLWSKEDYVNGY